MKKDIILYAGRDSGSRFGRALDNQLNQEGVKLNVNDRISKWCEFDSDVGFGKFNVINFEISNNKVEGEIKLTENFLTVGRKYNQDNICCFMKGYIWGVLEELTGAHLEVSHKKSDCAQFVTGSDFCIFHVKLDKEKNKKREQEMMEINLEEEL